MSYESLNTLLFVQIFFQPTCPYLFLCYILAELLDPAIIQTRNKWSIPATVNCTNDKLASLHC